MTALPKQIADRIGALEAAWFMFDRPAHVRARAALDAAILADRRALESERDRLAAESEARRITLFAVGEERRQEWARAERAEEALRALFAFYDERAREEGCYEGCGCGAVRVLDPARAVLSRIPPVQTVGNAAERDGDGRPESPAKSNASQSEG